MHARQLESICGASQSIRQHDHMISRDQFKSLIFPYTYTLILQDLSQKDKCFVEPLIKLINHSSNTISFIYLPTTSMYTRIF